MKNNKYVSSTRRRTPWEDKEDLSSLEVFIKDEYHQHYELHHQKISIQEVNLLNSVEIAKCRICDDHDLIDERKKIFIRIININWYPIQVFTRTNILSCLIDALYILLKKANPDTIRCV